MVAKKYYQVKQLRDRYKTKVEGSNVNLPVSSAILKSFDFLGISHHRTVNERRVFVFDGLHPAARAVVETILEFNSTNKFGVFNCQFLPCSSSSSKSCKTSTSHSAAANESKNAAKSN